MEEIRLLSFSIPAAPSLRRLISREQSRAVSSLVKGVGRKRVQGPRESQEQIAAPPAVETALVEEGRRILPTSRAFTHLRSEKENKRGLMRIGNRLIRGPFLSLFFSMK